MCRSALAGRGFAVKVAGTNWPPNKNKFPLPYFDRTEKVSLQDSIVDNEGVHKHVECKKIVLDASSSRAVR